MNDLPCVAICPCNHHYTGTLLTEIQDAGLDLSLTGNTSMHGSIERMYWDIETSNRITSSETSVYYFSE